MVMKSTSTIACLLVLVLVQATQDVPCVSARDLLQFSGLRNGFNSTNVFGLPNAAASSPPAPRRSPTVNIPGVDALTKGLTSGLTNATTALTNGLSNTLRAPANFSDAAGLVNGITPRRSPTVNIPGVDALTKGLTSGLTNATTALTNGLSNTLRAPANFSDAAGLVNGITSGRLANVTNGVTGALINATSGVANGIADAASGVTSGLTNPLGSPSRSSASTPNAEEAPGTTITETFYISSTGLGSTRLTATTHVPALSENQIPDLKSIFTNLLSKQSSSTDSPPESTTSSSPPPPTGFEFQFPGVN